MMKTANPADEIYAMLLQKSKAIDEFLSTTGLLQHALESDDLTAAEQFIKRRDKLIAAIDEIDRLISRCRQENRRVQSQVIIQRGTEMSENLCEKLRQIISVNQTCKTIAAIRREGIKKELAVLYKHGEGLHVYAAKAQGLPRFLNTHT
jgi:hypothetical protein